MNPSNYHLLCLPTFNVLSHTLSQPMMSSTILLPFNTHLDFIHSYLLHYTQLQLPLQQPPHHQFRLLLRCPSSTQLLLQHPPTTSRGPVATYCGHNKAAREKGISCKKVVGVKSRGVKRRGVKRRGVKSRGVKSRTPNVIGITFVTI